MWSTKRRSNLWKEELFFIVWHLVQLYHLSCKKPCYLQHPFQENAITIPANSRTLIQLSLKKKKNFKKRGVWDIQSWSLFRCKNNEEKFWIWQNKLSCGWVQVLCSYTGKIKLCSSGFFFFFLSNFFLKLGKFIFGRLWEKIHGFHQCSLLKIHSTKHFKKHFLFSFFPYFLKSTKLNGH